MAAKLPKIIFILLVIFAIFQTYSFLFVNLLYNPTSAADPAIKNPTDNLNVSIPNLKFSAPGPCTNDATKTCYPWIGEYIAGIYKYAIGFVGILATVVMMVGGIMWIVAGGNATTIGEAKSWITAALTGLVLALSSYLILYQINPNLVNFNAIGVARPEQVPPPPSSEAYINADKKVRDILTAVPSISINKAACQSQGQKDCTSLADLPNIAISGIKKIAAESKSVSVVVTGGTEAGHTEHGPNLPVVDLRLCPAPCVNANKNTKLLSYIHDQVGLGWGSAMRYNIRYTSTNGTFDVMREKNTDGSEHFHIRFK